MAEGRKTKPRIVKAHRPLGGLQLRSSKTIRYINALRSKLLPTHK